MRLLVFVLVGLFCLSPWSSPGLALALGLVLALTVGNPYSEKLNPWSKTLLQCCVVGLGFGMDLGSLLRAGREGFVLAAITIGLVLVLGRWSGKLLGIGDKPSALISSGTAICGGSAIAAVGGAIGAAQSEMAVALGTTFLLNGVALYLFPPLGHALGLTAEQFGTWAGIAIHDVSSVVGAAAAYGSESLDVATAVKLSRTLWIFPIAFGFAKLLGANKEGKAKSPPIPWFLFGFIAASVARTIFDPVVAVAPTAVMVSKAGMRLTLFLIGLGVSKKTLSTVGPRPLTQGVFLWVVIAVVSLSAVIYG